MGFEDLIDAYGTSYDALRLDTGAVVEQLWLDLGGPDELRARQFAEAAAALVEDAAQQTAVLTDAYVAEYAATVGRSPAASGSALDLTQFALDQLRGANPLDVYRRPAITTRAGLAAGKPFEQAMADAGHRANATAQADIALAHREAARQAMTETPGVDGYRRVLTGASCDLCRVASTQRYRTGELMPIHPRCDCRVAPIVDGYDGGRIVNRELYRELKAEGTLDRLSKRNRGTTGASRASRAAGRRSAQASIDGTQEALDLAHTPTVRTHGELGPVLVDDAHAFTAARASVDEVADAGDLTTRRPPKPPTASVDDVPAPPEVPELDRPPRFTKDTPSVIRAAQRRNIDPADMAAELEAKRARRLAEQKAERAAAAELNVDHPAVISAADRHGVTPDEIMAARPQVAEVKRVIYDEAARVQLEAFDALDHGAARTIAKPPAKGARSPDGRILRGGEWDWLDNLDEAERKRLRRPSAGWLSDSGFPIDVAAQQAESLGAIPGGSSTDDFAKWWLYHNRRYEAAGAIRQGRAPSARAYSGNLDIDDLIQIDGYTASRIVGVDELDAAGHIAEANRQLARTDALDYLGDAYNATLGPSPYRMSFQRWEEELRDLEYGLRNYPDEMPADALARLDELVPRYLDDPGTSYEELYARIVSTARLAGEDVPSSAVIPWADDVAPAIIPPEEFR